MLGVDRCRIMVGEKVMAGTHYLGRSIVLAVVLVVSLLLTACGGGQQEATPRSASPTTATSAQPTMTPETKASTPTAGPPKEVRIAFFMASAANSYAQAQLEGIQDAAQRLGAVVESFDGKFDSQVQYNQIQDAIVAGRYDIFIISPNDGNAIVPVVEEAISKGIIVACILAPCGPRFDLVEPQVEGQLLYAGVPFTNNGEDIGRLIVQACEGEDPCKVAYMPGLPELPLETARLDGIRKAIGGHDNIELILTSGGGYLADTAYPVAQDVLRAHPDLKVFASSGDQMIVGVELAVKDANRVGQVKLIGNGGTKTAVQATCEGRWFGTVAYYPRTEGRLAAEYTIRAAQGEALQPRGMTYPDFGLVIGPLITHENACQFQAEWEG